MTPVTADTRPPRNGPMLRHTRPAYRLGLGVDAARRVARASSTPPVASQRRKDLVVTMMPKHTIAVLVLGVLSLAQTARDARVRVGYCTGLQNLEAAKAAGFDYVELGTTEVAGLSDDDFEKAAARVRQIGLPTPA